MWHLFPSVPKVQYLVLGPPVRRTLTIFVGNWDADTLANYLSVMLKDDGVVVTYDYPTSKFYFSPGIFVDLGTTCHSILGLIYGNWGWYTESAVTINMCPVTAIKVRTSLSTASVPPDGVIDTIPIDVNYGELITHHDSGQGEDVIVLDHAIRSITVSLLDQDYNPLTTDEAYPDWSIDLYVTVIDHPAYTPLPNNIIET